MALRGFPSGREQTRTLLKKFYEHRSAIVHGNPPKNLTPADEDQRRTQVADIENVARPSLKTMISEGRPTH